MGPERWTEVDRYIADLLPADPALEAALLESERAGLPAISISPAQGQFLGLLARAQGARAILEIGTLGGYSAICLARALAKDGRLTTLELEPRHATVARANIERAGLADRIEIIVGPAKATLERLVAERAGPFDLVFIDADKPGYSDYFALALQLARLGTLIVADNVVREGEVADPGSPDPDVQAVRRFNALIAADRRVTASVLQVVGSKGYDGLAFAVVTGHS